MDDLSAETAPFDPAKARAICRRVADGETLAKVCASKDMPPYNDVCEWAYDNPEFGERLTAAQQRAGWRLADEVLEIADKADEHEPEYTPSEGERLQALRMRMIARQWTSMRWCSRSYARPAPAPAPAMRRAPPPEPEPDPMVEIFRQYDERRARERAERKRAAAALPAPDQTADMAVLDESVWSDADDPNAVSAPRDDDAGPPGGQDGPDLYAMVEAAYAGTGPTVAAEPSPARPGPPPGYTPPPMAFGNTPFLTAPEIEGEDDWARARRLSIEEAEARNAVLAAREREAAERNRERGWDFDSS